VEPPDNGSVITKYVVTAVGQAAPDPCIVHARSPDLPPQPLAKIHGLKRGEAYSFSVRAENAQGLSEPSKLSDLVTMAALSR
jgi:hypothetical protein